MTGWFSVKRGITAHPLFVGHPERLAIWIWLLDNVVWQDTKHDINGKTVTIPRGSVAVSERRIAAGAGVGYQVVRTFLQRLKDEHMINASVTHGKNVISLCNWGKYQRPEMSINAAPNASVTHGQRTKETREQDNTLEANASNDGRPSKIDLKKLVFDGAVSLLVKAGSKDREARGIVGRWRQKHSDAEIFDAITRAEAEGAVNPVEFIAGCLRYERDAADRQQSNDAMMAEVWAKHDHELADLLRNATPDEIEEAKKRGLIQ